MAQTTMNWFVNLDPGTWQEMTDFAQKWGRTKRELTEDAWRESRKRLEARYKEEASRVPPS